MGSIIKLHASPRSVCLAGTKPIRTFTEEELENARLEARREGSEEATRLLERQMLELRTDLVHLQSETFASLLRQHTAAIHQVQDALPLLVMEAARRVLAQTPIDREAVMRIVADLLSEIAPGGEKIEVHLAARDIELLGGYEASFREKYPEIEFRADADLRAGDCKVRSRFGLIDGRVETKLKAMEELLK